MPYRQFSHDEWWPVITLAADGGTNFFEVDRAEFTEEELAEIHQLERDFDKWQIKMAERFKVEVPSSGQFLLDDQGD
jgi:hypothetical protein